MTNLSSSNEIFFSIDMEADGPVPFTNSMLSLAVVAFEGNGTEIAQWECNLKPLAGAVQDPRTMTEFWAKNQEAWNYCNTNTVESSVAMPHLVDWVDSVGQGKQKVAVCFPAGYDFTWLYTYLMKFGGVSPFSFSCIDMKTYASALIKLPYRECGKKRWPRRWFDPKLPHTHKAVDDAREQGLAFLKMRAENLKGPQAVEEVSKSFWAAGKGTLSSPFLEYSYLNPIGAK